MVPSAEPKKDRWCPENLGILAFVFAGLSGYATLLGDGGTIGAVLLSAFGFSAGLAALIKGRSKGDKVSALEVEKAELIRTNELLQAIIVMTDKVVGRKISGLAKKAKRVSAQETRGDIFIWATKPINQLYKLLKDELPRLLRKTFGVEEDRVDLTVMRLCPFSKEWSWYFESDERPGRTGAAELMASEQSTAYSSYFSKKPVFYPNYLEAEGLFFKSERSVEKGSIYCYPFRIAVGGHEIAFVFTLYTNGGQLICQPADALAIERVELIMKQVMRRLHVELLLYSLQCWQYYEKGHQTWPPESDADVLRPIPVVDQSQGEKP